jgi:hypothetical protein
MKLRLLGAGFAVALSAGAVLAMPATSYATTCYTGCSPTTPTSPGGKPADGDGDGGATTPTATQAHSLAFTGANVVLPTSIGSGAIVVGGALVLAGRRRRVRSAS